MHKVTSRLILSRKIRHRGAFKKENCQPADPHRKLSSWQQQTKDLLRVALLKFLQVMFYTSWHFSSAHKLHHIHFLALLYKNTGRTIAVTTVSALASASALLKMLKFLVKVFKNVYLWNSWMDLVDTLPDVRYWSDVLC